MKRRTKLFTKSTSKGGVTQSKNFPTKKTQENKEN
jgi:hypothetical protein